MNYFRLSFDDNNDGIYETDMTFTVNPMDYKCFNKSAGVVSIPLLKGNSVQDSGVTLEGSIIELGNVYMEKADFETLYKRYTSYIRERQAATPTSHEYTLSYSALEKPQVWVGADTTDDTSLKRIDDKDLTWDITTPTKITLTAGAVAKVYFYFRKERKDLILTDHNLEQFLCTWVDAQFDPRISPLDTYSWTMKFIVLKKLYGTSTNIVSTS